jgi:biopolymer transport protein ExbB
MWLFVSLLLLGQADVSPPDSPAPPNVAIQPEAAAPVAGPAQEVPATAPAAGSGTAQGATPQAAPSPATEPDGSEGSTAMSANWLNDMMHSGALGYMLDGGIFMWPLLLLGVLALAVIIERFRALLMLNTRAEELRTKVRELLEADRIEEALYLCDREQGPVPAILAAGLRKYLVAQRLGYDAAKIEEQVVKGMDDYSIHIVAAMERHLPILATVSSAAPMIGFLGTVQGMVQAFADIVAKMGEMNIVQAAADGIKVSLLTTVLGLLVGIPAFIAFNYFTSVINEFVLDVEESASELIEAVTMQLAFAGKADPPPNVEPASDV